jgi:hypothetical protein
MAAAVASILPPMGFARPYTFDKVVNGLVAEFFADFSVWIAPARRSAGDFTFVLQTLCADVTH